MPFLGCIMLHKPCFRWLMLFGLFGAYLTVADASIFYSGHTVPVPKHRTYFESEGEEKLTNNRFEVSVIIQDDILERKHCECMSRYQCRPPRNIINLQTRDCHHREKVCCEI